MPFSHYLDLLKKAGADPPWVKFTEKEPHDELQVTIDTPKAAVVGTRRLLAEAL
jgi:hypothetical protein